MTIHNFGENNTILNQFIAELRDKEIQKDSMRFRKNIERIGEILGYEMSKTLVYSDKTINTPLGSKVMALPTNDLVLCAVLRAGLPLHQGVQNYFDTAENAFISAYRKHLNGGEVFEVVVKYLASPTLTDKTLVIIDPMLATGKTLENTYKAMEGHGKPKEIHIVSVIGSKQGVDFTKNIFPENTHLWIATIDDELNDYGYIVPGLGDAGDLSFGIKL